ncbi:hypothetical protein [Streptomyces sp. OK228]|uniref:hypothetical protein n=1 Tax=Streptomyces sp. OK228 TaxID=1882786 RepID=UPI0015CF6DE3|nr:hypothetical protein [Streptomyces sp. OK228]
MGNPGAGERDADRPAGAIRVGSTARARRPAGGDRVDQVLPRHGRVAEPRLDGSGRR